MKKLLVGAIVLGAALTFTGVASANSDHRKEDHHSPSSQPSPKPPVESQPAPAPTPPVETPVVPVEPTPVATPVVETPVEDVTPIESWGK